MSISTVCPAAVDSTQGSVTDLVRQLKSGNRDERVIAAQKLQSLGPNARDLVPALTKALLDGDSVLVSVAADALGAIGEAALPAAGALIDRAAETNASAGLVGDCQDALVKIGPAAVPAMLNRVIEVGRLRLPSGASDLERSNEEIAAWDRAAQYRGALIVVYRQLGTAAVPPLMKALDSPDRGLRYEAVMALGWVGTPARPALPRLRALLEQQNDQEFDEALRKTIARIEKG